MAIQLVVRAPRKNPLRYEFRCSLQAQPITRSEIRYRLRSVKRGFGSLVRHVIRFGYVAHNFQIAHHEIWDSIFPMMFLTRNGGPLFRKHAEAVIRFEYPILASVSGFYERRARNFGMDVRIEGEKFQREYQVETAGSILAFGGGKDSRMLLGALRELDRHPIPVTSDIGLADDIPEALIATPLFGVLGERLMPALMQLGSDFYFGSGFGEAHLNTPWHQYYDWGSPVGLAEFSGLLKSLGVDMSCHAPATALPYNLIQKILSTRYPELAKHQKSVKPDSLLEKNLHVALCETLHGLPHEHHCSDAVFKKLLEKFVQEQTARPDDFGFRNHREPINREMRAIIHRCKDRPQFAAVRDRIPDSWQAGWIDRIHPYEGMDRSFLDLFEAAISG